MNRLQFIVLAIGLLLVVLAVLFPSWGGLNYGEERTDSSGGSSWSAKSVRGGRFFLFSGPQEPRPSEPGAIITGFSPKLRMIQLITEAFLISAATAFLVWMLRTSPIVSGTHRREGMILVHVALLLYIVSLPLPAIDIAATPVSGRQAAYLSFRGASIAARNIFTSDGRRLGRGQTAACLMGAFANLLFASAYVALLARRHSPVRWPTYRACALMAGLAAGGTVGVLIPLMFGSEQFTVSIGYVLWVGAATLLAFAACRQIADYS